VSDSNSPFPIDRLYQIFSNHPNICTDTRKVRKGDIFFALKGDQFNGNHFAIQALDNGAAYAIIDEETGDPEKHRDRLIRTNNALTTLQALAAYHRNQFTIPFIAITGSNGKPPPRIDTCRAL
jgi:UDP-N-acetylmuramoyl-tripeptide--D-alanyl-D-alanine ligase